MQVGVIFASVIVYALAIFLWWRERAPNYFVALLAGHLAVLLSPFWQALYVFSYSKDFPILYRIGSVGGIQALARLQAFGLPRPVFLGAWSIMLAPLLIFFLYRHRWWFPGYLTSLLTFILFVLYHFLVETIGLRQGWWSYNGGTLPLGLGQPMLAALMNGLVSLSALAALLLTRRYALGSLLAILLPIPLALCLLVHGLLGAPLYTALLLQAQSWAGAIGLIGTLGLVASGVHIVASSLEKPREWRQMI
jgi:hypothetical protein